MRLVNIVNIINKDVTDMEIAFINLFIFILVKSNRKSNEKIGIRIIPINPK
jgi:hypothetical protein